MRGERYVVLGLAPVRSEWFRDVARWSTSASLPVEFVKCVSVDELRARLSSGRAFSAVLVDANVPGVDRDLVDVARAEGCAALIVDDGRATRDWGALGANAVLPGVFDRRDLVDALRASASLISRGDTVSVGERSTGTTDGWRGHLIAVTGPGGTGASTVAMALAQGLGADARFGGRVLLADFALDADLAMLHDAGDIVPGVQELVEAHRGGQPSMAETRALTFSFPDRHYSLLLGLRRHRDWASVRPRAFEAALDGLRRSYKAVVAEVTGDLEGEDECGSIDVADRNHMARTTIGTADITVLVGSAGPRGMHRLVRLVEGVVAHGVPVERIVPVINRAARSPRARAHVTAALAELTRPLSPTGAPLAPPVQLLERRRLDDLVHDASRMPPSLVDPLTAAIVSAVEGTDVVDHHPPTEAEPVRVKPGALGAYYEG